MTRRAGLWLACGLLAGCITDLVPLGTQPPDMAPAATTQMQNVGSGGAADLGPGAVADGGADGAGAAPALHFLADVQPDLDSLGCASCHSAGVPMTLVANPATAADHDANYANVSARAMNGAASLILTKPLTGSGVSHGGPKPFASTSDATYLRWLNWVNGGALK